MQRSESDAAREVRLAEILSRCFDASASGERPDLSAIVREHPDLADELRQLWATAMVADEFGRCIDPADVALEAASADSATGAAAGSIAAQTVSPETREVQTLSEQVGEYQLLEEIGHGGMGVVYRAHQPSLSRMVALKMLLHGDRASAADVARFRSEAESAARLSHPHIVPVYEVGTHDGLPFFSMQYVTGTTLARRLADGPLSGREAARLLIPVCRAIAHAHAHGVLHRDLKPSNILIDSQGRPFVSDFGLAKQFRPMEVQNDGDPRTALGALTQTGAILGTPGYMAPEQAAGRRGMIGPATDVYSLGAILYAMLTARPPFQAATPVDTVLMMLEQDPIPPRLLNRQADADLEMIALKCLQKPCDLRYSSAAAVADDLEAFLAGEPVSARSSHISQIVSRAFRETHHAAVLENWGLLWMLHAAVLLVLCLITNALQLAKVTSPWPYLALWVIGLSVWAAVFWNLRRRAGPTTFVERQIAHIWAGSMIASSLLYAVEMLLGLPVLTLSPVLALISGGVFLAKAGILTGAFYVQSAALFATAVLMAALPRMGLPDVGLSVFGVVSGMAFFWPGLKYYRLRRGR